MKKHSKKKSSNKKTPKLKYIIYFLLLVIFSLLAFIIGILYTQKTYEKELHKSKNSIKILQQKIKKLKKQNTPSKSTISSEIIDYKKSHNTTVILPPKFNLNKKTDTTTVKKPKLVIIIDDVSFHTDIKRIKAIPYHITPSFFPPTKTHPNTPFYASKFTRYMVHLPMQAIHFPKPEPKTLNVGDSYKKILNRIKEIKKEFPKAKYINNHTGSTFTADNESMKKLFKALKTEHLGFVDSKTTPNSKAIQANKNFHIPLYSRNIFLDNIEQTQYIRNQLKKAVLIAKKRGYAIAIGHPHAVTLETLKNAKDILKNVNVVYIDELDKEN